MIFNVHINCVRWSEYTLNACIQTIYNHKILYNFLHSFAPLLHFISHSIVIYWKCDRYHVPNEITNQPEVSIPNNGLDRFANVSLSLSLSRLFFTSNQFWYIIFHGCRSQKVLHSVNGLYTRVNVNVYHFSDSNTKNIHKMAVYMTLEWKIYAREWESASIAFAVAHDNANNKQLPYNVRLCHAIRSTIR